MKKNNNYLYLIYFLLFITLILVIILIVRKNNKVPPRKNNIDYINRETDEQREDLDIVEIGVPKPFVTAMCVTRKRVPMLKRAVKSFLNQSYPAKEMLIVYDHDDTETASFHSANRNASVRFLVSEGNKTLGHLRNLAVQEANGDFVIQWDDDDEYHQDRIWYQLRHSILEGGKASTLERWMITDDITGRRYISHARIWEGTILAPRKLLLYVPYPKLKKGEDSVVIQELSRRNLISTMKMPYLYTYHLHGRNTFNRAHGLRIIKDAILID